MAVYYLYSEQAGPYEISCALELAEALSNGHTMLEHEDAYMAACEQHADRIQAIADAEAKAHYKATMEFPEIVSAHSEEIKDDSDRWWSEVYPDRLTLKEPDYSSPEYLGEPEWEDLAPPTPIPFSKKFWSIEEITELIDTNDKAVYRAVHALVDNRQFVIANKEDWQDLLLYRRWIEQDDTLDPYYFAAARKLAKKYAENLQEVANAKRS